MEKTCANIGGAPRNEEMTRFLLIGFDADGEEVIREDGGNSIDEVVANIWGFFERAEAAGARSWQLWQRKPRYKGGTMVPEPLKIKQ